CRQTEAHALKSPRCLERTRWMFLPTKRCLRWFVRTATSRPSFICKNLASHAEVLRAWPASLRLPIHQRRNSSLRIGSIHTSFVSKHETAQRFGDGCTFLPITSPSAPRYCL